MGRLSCKEQDEEDQVLRDVAKQGEEEKEEQATDQSNRRKSVSVTQPKDGVEEETDNRVSPLPPSQNDSASPQPPAHIYMVSGYTAVSSIYTMPEMYHGRDLYPTIIPPVNASSTRSVDGDHVAADLQECLDVAVMGDDVEKSMRFSKDENEKIWKGNEALCNEEQDEGSKLGKDDGQKQPARGDAERSEKDSKPAIDHGNDEEKKKPGSDTDADQSLMSPAREKDSKPAIDHDDDDEKKKRGIDTDVDQSLMSPAREKDSKPDIGHDNDDEKKKRGINTDADQSLMSPARDSLPDADQSLMSAERRGQAPTRRRQRPQHPGAYHVGGPDPLPMEDLSAGTSDRRTSSGARQNMTLPLQATVVPEEEQDNKPNGHSNEDDTPAKAGPILEAVPFRAPRQRFSLTTKLHLAVVAFLMVVVIVLLVLGLTGTFKKSSSSIDEGNSRETPNADISPGAKETLQTRKSTLQIVREDGLLKCDHTEVPPSPQWQGIKRFSETMCEAVSAAIFGSPKVEFVATQQPRRAQFEDLVNKKIHLMTFGLIFTMERNVFDANLGVGFDFSLPYLYEGMKLAGDTFYVESCVDNNFKHIDECKNMRICVHDGSTYHKILATLVPRRFLQPLESNGLYALGLVNGTCNLFASSTMFMPNNETIRAMGYTGDFSVSNSQFSMEPLAIVTRSDDPEWSDFVNSVLVALQVAEKRNITKATADLFPQTYLFGNDYPKMFQNAIRQAGNLGELQHQHVLKYKGARSALNHLNNGMSGLLHSLPFGAVGTEREDDVALGDSMANILLREKLRCGIRSGRQGFAAKSFDNKTNADIYRGMEVDYCIALAASLFRGGTASDVFFVDLSDQQDGFQKLASGAIDVFAGATWTLENDCREPTTGLGFSFSTPYFYGYSEDEDNLVLATRQDDHDWSTLVYWIVASTIFAEERGIGQEQSNRMPECLLYGRSFNRLFRDAILSVGNYNNIYQRNLQQVMPRGGRNRLNTNSNLGGQHYVFSGLLD